MEETVAVIMTRYYTPEKEPTCSLGTIEGKFCRFLGCSEMGTDEVCMWTQDRLERDFNSMGEPGLGYLIPCSGCLLFPEENND